MTVNEYFDKVVVINLDRRPDRMEKLGTQLDELGIEYERFSAVDANELGISPIEAGTRSHYQVLSEHPEEKILILEDDALFCEDFNAKFDEVIQELPAVADIFYLGALLPKHTGRVESIGNKYWFKQIFSTGSHAYSLNPARVKSAAEFLQDYTWYIDIGLREWGQSFNAYIAQPNLVTQFPSYSDLRGEDVDDFN